MSHIDSFKHEMVGLLAGLPVYHPLEDIVGDFSCTPENLLIGGGSGEHPALVIESPLKAVALFLHEEIKSYEGKNLCSERFPLINKIDEWQQVIAPYLTSLPRELVTFYEWEVETYNLFVESCRCVCLPNRLDEEDFETWLILGVGEFVFFSMPELASEIMTQLVDPYQYFCQSCYNNILLVPPNFPVYANGGNAFKFTR